MIYFYVDWKIVREDINVIMDSAWIDHAENHERDVKKGAVWAIENVDMKAVDVSALE